MLALALVGLLQVEGEPAVSTARAASATREGTSADERDVVVTARKREERLKDVPLTVDTVRPESVPDASGNDLGAAVARVPNAAFVGTGFSGNNLVSVRGLGGLATFGPFDAAVSVTVNELPVPIRSFDTLLLDAERVEVLKGPQGTLYGRSALGGAINIVTRMPARAWSGEGRIEGGERGYRLAEAAAGGPIADHLSIRAAVKYTGFDGDIPALLLNDRTNKADILSGRFTTRATLGELTSLTLSFQGDRERRRVPAALLRSDPRFPLSGEDVLARTTRDTERVTARLEHDLGGVELVALGGYEWSRVGNRFDLTDSLIVPAAFGIPAAFVNDPANDKSRTRTHERTASGELRLQSTGVGLVRWTVGASALRLSVDRNLSRRSIIPSFNIDEDQTNRNTTVGLFGDIGWRVSERLELGAGVRIARDKITYRGLTRFFGPLTGRQPFPDTADVADTYATGQISAAYDLGGVNAFVRLARGYGSGGFGEFAANGLSRQPIRPFRPATNDAAEAGIKSAGRWGFATLAAFVNDVKDGQTYSFDPTTFANTSENLDFRSYGLEAQASLKATAWLHLDGALGLQRARFRDAPEANLSGARNGGRVPNTPEVSASASASGEVPLRGGVSALTYHLSVTHAGDRAADAANAFDLDAFTIMDARVGVRFGRVELYAFGANLGDERAQLYGQNFGSIASPIPTVNVGRGRVLGLGLSGAFR